MVDELIKVGELLKLPDLEDETKRVINDWIRKRLTEQKPQPLTKEEIPTLIAEWLNGAQKGGDG